MQAIQYTLTFFTVVTFKSKRAKANVRVCLACSAGTAVDAGCLVTDSTAALT